ncbi:uncharacterized protein LOC133208782 [Neopsephotus bourkii]|uniref:uncharacterized protein LOC133208782 n=1 Tax=Neopsephotus bourkii TaxID=309878 RepID=UPI002AA52BB8|nr:uncharacterized protein LOC133208782 [Neopsephotus bourkii]
MDPISLSRLTMSIWHPPAWQQEDQKLKFLDAVCTICTTSSKHSFLWGTLLLLKPELAESLEVLLQEEPVDRLDTTVRQQVMLTIAAMSRAELLLEDKNSLLEACFCSIFQLPPQDSQGPGAWLYDKTLSAMDSMLQVLVCSARTLGIRELKNIFKLLLPFISSEVAVVQERAVACTARLARCFSTKPLPQLCSCSVRVPKLQCQCWKTVVMGKLVGHLTLCCTHKDTGTCLAAAEALFMMHPFTLSRYPCLLKRRQQQHQQSWEQTHSLKMLRTSDTRHMFSMFTKHLQPSERTDIILVAIKTLANPGVYSVSTAAHMLDILVPDTSFRTGQVSGLWWH